MVFEKDIFHLRDQENKEHFNTYHNLVHNKVYEIYRSLLLFANNVYARVFHLWLIEWLQRIFVINKRSIEQVFMFVTLMLKPLRSLQSVMNMQAS